MGGEGLTVVLDKNKLLCSYLSSSSRGRFTVNGKVSLIREGKI